MLFTDNMYINIIHDIYILNVDNILWTRLMEVFHMIENICSVIIVWNIRGKTIRTVMCALICCFTGIQGADGFGFCVFLGGITDRLFWSVATRYLRVVCHSSRASW